MSTAVKTEKNPMTRKRVMYLVGIIVQLVLPQFIPTWGGITEMGVKMLFTFIGTMILFMGTNDLAGSCLVTAIVTMIHGYADAATMFAQLLGNSITMQMIMLLMYSIILTKTGVMVTLGRWIISRSRVFQKVPLVFNLVLMLVLLVCNFFIGGTTMVFTLLPLFEGIAAAVGFKVEDKWHKIMVTGLFMMSVTAQYSRGVDGMTMNWRNIFAQAVDPALGYVDNTIQFMLSARAGLILFVILFVILAKVVFRCDMRKLADVDMDAIPELRKENIHFTWNQLLMLGLFLVVILRGYISAPFTAGTEAARIYSVLSLTVVTMIALVVTSLVNYKGTPITDLQEAFSKLPLGVVFSLGLMGTVAGSLGNAELGIRGWLISLMEPVFGGLPYPLFVFFILLFTCVLTNLMSNQATIIMMSTLAATFLTNYAGQGYNFITLCASICMVGNISCITYSSGPVSPLYLSRPEFQKDTKFVYTIGIVMMLLSTVIFTCTTVILGKLF